MSENRICLWRHSVFWRSRFMERHYLNIDAINKFTAKAMIIVDPADYWKDTKTEGIEGFTYLDEFVYELMKWRLRTFKYSMTRFQIQMTFRSLHLIQSLFSRSDQKRHDE